MIGILLALLSAVFIGVSQFLLRKSYKELKPSIAFFFDSIFGLLIWVPLALVMGVTFGLGIKEALVYALISAVLSEAIVFYALSHGELAITATVLATYPAYTVLFSWIINHESLPAGLLTFVIIAILGSILASSPKAKEVKNIRPSKAVVWPFIAAICIGLSDTVSKGYINRSGDFSLLFMLGFVQIPVALAYLRIEKERVVIAMTATLHSMKTYKWAILGGFFNIVGTGFLWLSFSYAPASVASPVTGVNGIVTILLARYFMKDHISKKQYAAIAIALFGVIGIALSRS